MLLLSLLLLFLPGKDAGAVGISLNNNWQEQVTSSGTVVFAPLGSLTQYPGTLAELGILQAGIDTLGWLFGENVANPASTSPRALELYQPAGGLSLAINQQTNELAIGLGLSGGFPVFKGEPNGVSMAGAESVGGAVYLSSSVWFSGANQPVQINIQSGAEIQTNAPILNMIANNPAIQAAPPNSYLTISPGVNTGPINAGNINAANISAQAVTANNGLVVASSQAVFDGTATFNSGVFTGGGVFIPKLTQTPDVAQNWLNLGNDPNGNGGSLIMTSIGALPGATVYPFNALGTVGNPQGFLSGYGIYILSPSYSDPQGNVIDFISGGPTEFVSVVSTDPIGSPITSTGPQPSGWAVSAGPSANYSILIATTGATCIGQNCAAFNYIFDTMPEHQLEVHGDIFAQTDVTAVSSITASAFFGDGSHLTGITNASLLPSTNTWTGGNTFQAAVYVSSSEAVNNLYVGGSSQTDNGVFQVKNLIDFQNETTQLGGPSCNAAAPLSIYDVAIGSNALHNVGAATCESGGLSVGIGLGAGENLTAGGQNIMIGGYAGNGLHGTITGDTCLGTFSCGGTAGSVGGGDTIIGNHAYQAGQSGIIPPALALGGGGNVVLGLDAAAYPGGAGFETVIIGYQAGFNLGGASSDVIIGAGAGGLNGSGIPDPEGILIGAGVGLSAHNGINIGNVFYAQGTQPGNTPGADVNVSIGTTSATNGSYPSGVNFDVLGQVVASSYTLHENGKLINAFTKPFSFPVAFTWIGSATLTSGTTIFYNVPASSRTVANISGVVETAGVGGSGDSIVCHDSAGSVTLGFAAGAAKGTTTSIAANFAQNDPLFCYIETTATTQPTINVNLEIAPQ